jgi:hypothetical protein
MTEDEDYEVDLDLPPEWTDEEIRGVKRFAEIMLSIAHPTKYLLVLNELQRTAINSNLPIDRLNLPKKPKRTRTVHRQQRFA